MFLPANLLSRLFSLCWKGLKDWAVPQNTGWQTGKLLHECRQGDGECVKETPLPSTKKSQSQSANHIHHRCGRNIMTWAFV